MKTRPNRRPISIQWIADTRLYEIGYVKTEEILLYRWQALPDLTKADYQSGVSDIADYVRILRPAVLAIDTTRLRCEINFDTRHWWSSKILPVYLSSGLKKLAHIHPNCPKPGWLPAHAGLPLVTGNFCRLSEIAA